MLVSQPKEVYNIMPNVIIYHNPQCSKSREALALIEKKGIKPIVIEYLKHPPNMSELAEILKLLRVSAFKLMRDHDPLYKELGMDKLDSSEAAILTALAKHPRLLQRPIVIHGHRAVIARPAEKVLEIL